MVSITISYDISVSIHKLCWTNRTEIMNLIHANEPCSYKMLMLQFPILFLSKGKKKKHMALNEKHALAPHEMRTRTSTMTTGSKLTIPGFVSISFGSSIKSEPN